MKYQVDYATNYVVHIMDKEATEHNFILKANYNMCLDTLQASALGLKFLNIRIFGTSPELVGTSFRKLIVIKKDKEMMMKDIYRLYLTRKKEICNS